METLKLEHFYIYILSWPQAEVKLKVGKSRDMSKYKVRTKVKEVKEEEEAVVEPEDEVFMLFSKA